MRIESALAVRRVKTRREFGGDIWFGFERLTNVPIQTKMVKESMLSKEEKTWLKVGARLCRVMDHFSERLLAGPQPALLREARAIHPGGQARSEVAAPRGRAGHRPGQHRTRRVRHRLGLDVLQPPPWTRFPLLHAPSPTASDEARYPMPRTSVLKFSVPLRRFRPFVVHAYLSERGPLTFILMSWHVSLYEQSPMCFRV
jgi:hypothetical protein